MYSKNILRNSKNLLALSFPAVALAIAGACGNEVIDPDGTSSAGTTSASASASATSSGGAGGEGGKIAPPRCLHDPCELGSQLDPACDDNPCVAAICAESDYCCEVRWDDLCASAVLDHPDVCACAPESRCQNLIDDDFDGDVDCLDDACAAAGKCVPGSTPVGGPCTENADCMAEGDDPLCISAEIFEWPGGYCSEFCLLGAPCGDGQGLCIDTGVAAGIGVCHRACDEAEPSACRPGYSCRQEAGPGPVCLPVPEDCGVPGDEDLDGDADCLDHACTGALECFEICDDGLDDNQNGTVDCDDPTCVGLDVCAASFRPMCDATVPVPATGCVDIGGQFQCDPVTGAGCLEGQTCSLVGGGFICFGPPNEVPLCGECGGLHGRCAPGMGCVSPYDNVCTRFCCTDADCGPGGDCNLAALTLTLGSPDAPPVGMCVLAGGQ